MFNFNIDKKTIYIIIGILALATIIGYIQRTGELLALLLTLPGVIIAITFHEFAHAEAAYRLGDDTPKYQGRLTLNPLAHIDPIGLLMLIFIHIGWGKPVQINPRNFNRKMSMSAQEAIVALAGPLMNIFIAFILTIIIFAITVFSTAFILTILGYIIMLTLQLTVTVNIGLGVFNLIPIPPLDGSKILMHFLPYESRNWFLEHQNIFYLIFLVLWITNLISYITAPVISFVSNGIYNLVALIFNLFI